jgi:monovalent cation/hydrogen antiporter
VHLALSLAALAVVVIVVVATCRRLDLPAPLILVALGAGASYLPIVPHVHLTSEVVLVGLLPPLLYSAALQTSLVDFNVNRRPILLLSVGLVAFTTVGVAVTAYVVIPAITWPAAFALGAVVAPPDAVSATAIARRIGIPRRIVTILEGESLLNDATALVALRTAVGVGGSVSVLGVGLDFAVAALGGILVGVVLYVVVGKVRRLVTDPVIDTSLSLVTPFVAYVTAEEIHGSGVLAVVVAGLLLGHKAPILQSARSRIAERLNWRTISFLLENSVFLLIGLQARWIIDDVDASGVPVTDVVKLCVATFVAVVVLRLVWVFPVRALLVRPGPDKETGEHPSWQHTAVLGWAGMRGVVTLAAAFAIPETSAFAYRETLILTALVVAAGTLFVQGSTLPWLVRRLRLSAPDPREDHLARAALFEKATAAGLKKLEEHIGDDDPFDTVGALRTRVSMRNTAAWERLGASSQEETPSEAYTRLRRDMLDAERRKVLEVRSSATIPHEVVEEVLADLDIEESMLDFRTERVSEAENTETVSGVAGTIAPCEHLEAAPKDVPSSVEGECEDCVRDGFTSWVHLRKCLTCGHLGCCDSSPRRHASAHFEDVEHPVMRSAEPGEEWRWCFVDSRLG